MRTISITLVASSLLAVAGCDNRDDLRAERIPLPPPQAREQPTPSTEPQPEPTAQPAEPEPEVREVIDPPAPPQPMEGPVTEGSSRETWKWHLDATDLRELASPEGPLVVIQARDALSDRYQLVRYAWQGSRWTTHSQGIPDTYPLDCRVVTPRFGPIYHDLPALRSLDDRWLIAFPGEFMAAVEDLREPRRGSSEGFRVVLRRAGRGLTASFEDSDGRSIADSITIGN